MKTFSCQRGSMRSATIGIVTVTLMMLISASASAQIVRACVNTVNGRISLLTDDGCGPKEQLVEWSLQGVRGPEGPPGPTGAQGPAGHDGAQGPGGPQGAAGTNGTPGQNGVQGPAGSQGPTGAKGDAGLDGAPGPVGPLGPAGSQGPQGPQGPQGADGQPAERGGLLVVDAAGQEVGTVADAYNGYVLRRVGDDMVWFAASYSGLPAEPTIFFHLEANCGGERYLQIIGNKGLAYFANVHQGVVFYTTTLDPWLKIARPVYSYEVVGPTEDARRPALKCVAFDGSPNSVGIVTMVSDDALASLKPPFRIK
jgi:hypothetical protein